MFGVLGGRRLGPTILVHSPTLLLRLDQLADDVELVAFVEDSPPDAATIATIDDMVATISAEDDGLVRFQMAAEAIKLTGEEFPGGTAAGPALLITGGIDRSTLVSFRPPELLRAFALVAAVARPPSDLWVNPAGLVVANGGRIDLYPRTPFPV